MNSGRVMHLRVTIPAESRRMNVGKDVIRILGSPAYICVLQRKDRKSIAITPCAAEHPMSFKVPDRLLTDGKHLVELKRELNKEVGYKGVQLVTISRPTAYGEYAPYHFVDTEQEFQTLVKGLRP